MTSLAPTRPPRIRETPSRWGRGLCSTTHYGMWEAQRRPGCFAAPMSRCSPASRSNSPAARRPLKVGEGGRAWDESTGSYHFPRGVLVTALLLSSFATSGPWTWAVSMRLAAARTPWRTTSRAFGRRCRGDKTRGGNCLAAANAVACPRMFCVIFHLATDRAISDGCSKCSRSHPRLGPAVLVVLPSPIGEGAGRLAGAGG
jgi:hypothetical protein